MQVCYNEAVGQKQDYVNENSTEEKAPEDVQVHAVCPDWYHQGSLTVYLAMSPVDDIWWRRTNACGHEGLTSSVVGQQEDRLAEA